MSTCCAGNHDADCIYVPKPHLSHTPLGGIPMNEIEVLLKEGILTRCDGSEIYALKGKGTALICADPSLFVCKTAILNAKREFSIFSTPGYGLRFDPNGPYGDGVDSEILRVKTFLDGPGGAHFGLKSIILGSHAPCGAAEGMSLRDICYTVAAGARHLNKETGAVTIPTIFINALVHISDVLNPVSMLLWFNIHMQE